jgi:Fe-S cluster biosynthesis and repair protein YggX
MIKIKAREQNTERKQYETLPEGKYIVEIVAIEPWKEQVKAVEFINVKDEKGNLMKDDNGKIIKEEFRNYEFFTLDMKLKIIDGPNTGRIIYGNLTTHDNVLFLTEGFLFATGVDQLNDINDLFKFDLVGKTLQVETTNQTYTKEVMNQDTGMTEPVERTKTRIKRYYKNPIVKNKA